MQLSLDGEPAERLDYAGDDRAYDTVTAIVGEEFASVQAELAAGTPKATAHHMVVGASPDVNLAS